MIFPSYCTVNVTPVISYSTYSRARGAYLAVAVSLKVLVQRFIDAGQVDHPSNVIQVRLRDLSTAGNDR